MPRLVLNPPTVVVGGFKRQRDQTMIISWNDNELSDLKAILERSLHSELGYYLVSELLDTNGYPVSFSVSGERVAITFKGSRYLINYNKRGWQYSSIHPQ